MDLLHSALKYDGFLRMELGAVLASRFIHLFSDLNPPHMQSLLDDGSVALASGLSEWHSLDSRAISLGWDWAVSGDGVQMTLVRTGLPRSNVMLVDSKGRDYGWLESLEALATVVDALPWRNAIWHGMQDLSPV